MACSLSLFRNNRNWRGLSHGLDPEQLPCEIDLVPPRWAFWLIVAAGLAWMLVALNLLGDFDLDLSVLTLVGLLFPAIGLVPLGYGLLALFERRQATFGRDGVEVAGRSLCGRESWSLPYAAYRGVLHREHVVRRRNSSSTTYQIVELHHDDPEKTLPLSVEATAEIPRGLWEGYARALDLPALERSGGRLVGRAAADLDKSMRTLAAEGKVEQRFDPDARPPQGISIAHEAAADQIGGERLRVTVTTGRVPLWVLALFAVLAAVVFAAAVAVAESLGMAAIPAAVFLVVVVVFRFDRRNPRQIVITRKAVALIDAWQGTSAKGKSLKLDEIESVTIRAARPSSRGRLVIAADKGSLILGAGLPRPALDWLADYLTAAVTTA